MDPFLDFPDDKLYELCESLPNKDLNKFIRSSKRIQFACQGEITRRNILFNKRVDEEMKRIKGEMDKVNFIFEGHPVYKDSTILYKDKFDEDPIGVTQHSVRIERFKQGGYRITQEDIAEGPQVYKSSWILGKSIPPVTSNEHPAEDFLIFSRIAILRNDAELRLAVENLITLGYSLP